MLARSLALDHLLRAVGDPIAELADIGPGHVEFEAAQIIRAAAGVLAKAPEGSAAIEQAIRATDLHTASPRTRAHLAAAAAWLSGQPGLAAEHYASILTRWPDDLLALRLAQSCYFFLGWHDRLRALMDAVLAAWPPGQDGLDFVRAWTAFAHAETGDPAYAEALGREALARDPACPMGVHAVAHALAAAGRPSRGAEWMRAQRAHWAGPSRMLTHNAWHLAMFDTEVGDVASAFAILDSILIPASTHATVDACDAAALLWRLTRAGIDDAGRWARLSDAFERTLTSGFWAYVDLYAALTHLAAGNHPRMQRLERAIETCAQAGDFAGLRARHITQPAMRVLRAWSERQYGEAARLLAEVRPLIGAAGGSRIQLEVFANIEHEAARRQRDQRREHPGTPRYAPRAACLRQVAGGKPNSRLNARLKAASDS